MRYGSVCSGIEAASVAWQGLGWQPAWFAEIEPFCNALLAHHYPTVKNHGDFTQIGAAYAGTIDLLVGGTPCQSFSVAGLRKGLDDPRGHLTLQFFALVDRLRPKWVVWENVPGVLFDDGGRTFGTVLGLLGECGYGFAYRVLDAQFAGVPQRRRRVFVVGYRGDWRRAAAVLFESHSLQGHSPPSRKTGEGTAASLTRGAESRGRNGHGYGGYAGRRREDDVNLVAGTLTHDYYKQGGNAMGEMENGLAPGIYSNSGQDWWRKRPGTCTQRDYKDGHHAGLVIPLQEVTGRQSKNQNGVGIGIADQFSPMYTLQSGQQHGIAQQNETFTPRGHEPSGENMPSDRVPKALSCKRSLQPTCATNTAPWPHTRVRRLLPTECEFLQGFPRNYTLIPYNGKPAKDSPRYRALGNSFAVPVVRWIGERIQMVEDVLRIHGASG